MNFILEKVELKDINEILKLQKKSGDKNLFSFHNEKSLTDNILNNRTLCIRNENNEIISFSVFKHILDAEYKRIPSSLNNKKVGKFSGTVVLNEYKGKGIHSLFLKSHLEYAKKENYNAVLSYAHKENPASIKNINKAGLKYISNNGNIEKKNNRNIYLITF